MGFNPSLFSYAKGRSVTADTEVNIDAEYKSPVLMLQNTGATDANVTFNCGVAFVIKAIETVRFDPPVYGEISSDQDLAALA